MPAAAAIRRRKCAGERSAGVAPTKMSVPRGANAFSAIIWESSTDLPNPGPATTNDGAPLPAGVRRFDQTRPSHQADSHRMYPFTITLRSDRPER